MPDYDPHAPKQAPTFDPFANDAATVAYYGGERVSVLERNGEVALIQYADGSILHVNEAFIQVGAK